MPTQNDPKPATDTQKHQILTKEIYKRGLELLKEKKHAENLLYHISEAVVAIDSESRINIINKAAEELMGIVEREAEGKKLEELLELYTEAGSKVAPSEFCFKPWDVSLANLTLGPENARKFIKLQSATITNPEGEDECIVTLTDITREKLLEKSKDEFISVTSHELRTPMTVIKSYLWMLQNGKGGNLTQKQKDYLIKAVGGVERMLSMINDTLNTSKIDQGRLQLKIERIHVAEILNDMIPDFRLKANEKGLELKVAVSADCEKVYADSGKFREMLTNLLGNAIKFTTNGWVKLDITKAGDSFIKFEIADTGKGIDPADIKRLFQKFGRIDNSYQTVAEAGGTGLGLYIVKSYVENMGGKIGVASEGLGKGSTFWFTLPSSYYEIPEALRETAVASLAVLDTQAISSICPM